MKKKTLGKIISAVLSLIMVLSLMAVPAAVSAESVAEQEKVYWAEQFSYSKSTLTEVDASTYYTYDAETDCYTHTSNWSCYNNWALYKPFIMLGEYRNFKLEFDMTFAPDLDQQWFDVLMGADSKTSVGWADGSGAEDLKIGIGTKFTADSTTVSGSDLFKVYGLSYSADGTETGSKWGNVSTTFDGATPFHVTVTVAGGAYSVVFKVGDTVYHSRNMVLNENYDGGYVGVSACGAGMKIANIEISEIDPEDYAFYGSPGGIKAPYEPTYHYAVTEDAETGSTKYTRNSTNADGKGWNNGSFINFGVHDEFELTFKGKFNADSQQYFTVGLGAQVAGNNKTANGASYVYLGYNGGKTHAYSDAYDAGIWGDNTWQGYHFDTAATYAVIDYSKEHTFTVSVKNGVWTYSIDGLWTNSRAMCGLYKGGYVSIGCNADGAYFYDVKITDYTPAEELLATRRNATSLTNAALVDASAYYEITTDEGGNKSYKRLDNGSENDSGAWSTQVAFLNTGAAKDFRLDFDFDYSEVTDYTKDNINESPIWVALGDVRWTGYNRATGSTMLALRQSMADGSMDIPNLTDLTKSGGGWMAACTSHANYQSGRLISTSAMSNHVTITVHDGLLTLECEDTTISYYMPSNYVGGYVQLGVKTPGIILSNITFKDLSNVKTEDYFATYYSEDIGVYANTTTTATSGDLTAVDADTYWNYDGENLISTNKYSSTLGAGYSKNMAVAYLAEQEYTEFELSFDYRYHDINNVGIVGFGATEGKSWLTDSAGTWEADPGNHFIGFRAGGNLEWGVTTSYLNDPANKYPTGWFSNYGGNLFTTTNEYYTFHNCVIRVENGKAAVTIDGQCRGAITLRDGYDGGYIYFVSNTSGVAFKNISVTDLTGDTVSYDIPGFTAYYSDMISSDTTYDKGLTKVTASDYWTYNSTTNSVSRILASNNAESDSPATKSNWAQLFYNEKLENFEMEVDITQGIDAWQRLYIGIGAQEIGASLMGNANNGYKGGLAFHSYPDGMGYRNLAEKDGYTTDSETGYIYNEDGQRVDADGYYLDSNGNTLRYVAFNLVGRYWNQEAFGYEWRPVLDNSNSAARTVHLRIVVQDRLVSLYVNGSDTAVTNWTMPIWYEENEGGYISFGTTSSYATFANLTVNGIDALEPIEDANLNGKSALFVGDSISVGATDDAMAYAWGGRIGREYGMSWVNQSNGGATLAEYGETDILTIVDQMLMHKDREFDYVIVQGGVNDAMRKLDVGSITAGYSTDVDDYDLRTFAGALEYLFAYATDRWGDSEDFHIGYIVTFKNRWIGNGSNGTAPYYNTARAICQKWGVPYLDLNGDNVGETMKWANTLYIPDGIHPNGAGYEVLVDNYIADWMCNLGTWVGLDNIVRGDVDISGATDAADLAEMKKALLGMEDIAEAFGYVEDLGEADIYGELITINPDVNGDTTFNILDLIRMKKILAGAA